MGEPFSKRIGISSHPPEISVREAATPFLRESVAREAAELGVHPTALRDIICRLRMVVPDRNNWSAYPNVWDETIDHLEECAWNHVYDFAELVFDRMRQDDRNAEGYQAAINEICVASGIGWQMVNGLFQSRGTEGFDVCLENAKIALAESGRKRASTEMSEAVRALSRRPKPDSAGAIGRAMGAVECLCRDIAGDTKPTLGDIIKKYRCTGKFPPPMDVVIEKLWGHASEVARHPREGQEPSRADAELVVGVAATVCNYLAEIHSDESAAASKGF